MSRIACVWADLGEDDTANDWYEKTHVADVVSKLNTEARHGQPAEDNMFKEVPSIEGTHMTIYDLPGDQDAQDFDAQIQPALDRIPGGARIDTRCYKEFASWHGEEWQGGENAGTCTLRSKYMLTYWDRRSRHPDVDRRSLAAEGRRT